MSWIDSAFTHTSDDHYFEHAVSASTGKVIVAGGYWISGNQNTEVWVQVNGPSTDVNGVAGGWVVKGYTPDPPSSWSVVVYALEEDE